MPRKPKLLVVIGTLAHMGGAERQALYLVEYLVQQGALVEVLAFEDGEVLRPALDSAGVKVHVSPYYFRAPRIQRMRALATLAWTLKFKIKPDALLPFVGVHSKTIAQVWPYTGATFCWWNQQDEGRDLTGTPLEKKILERVSVITSNSEAGRIFLSNTYGIDASRILVYNNGTPVSIQVDEANVRAKLGLGHRRVVSMIGNVTPFKDHATLIDAWKAVRNHFSDGARPILVLAGHLNDRSVVDRLKIQTFELGLSNDDVRFVGPIKNVDELIAASELIVHSSLTEGCPNAVCEAMALARAVVATDIPGCRQALGEHGVPFLAKPHDRDSLSGLIIRMLDDDALRLKEGEMNRQRITSEFSIAGMNRFFRDTIERGLGVAIGG